MCADVIERLAILKIAYDQAEKGLDAQCSALSGLRQRVTIIIGLSGLVATFLGKEAIKPLPSIQDKLGGLVQFNGCEIIAIIFLCLTFFCAFQIIRPRSGWIFYSSPSLIISQFVKDDKNISLAETYEKLCEFNEINYNKNKTLLKSLYFWLYLSFLFVIGQIIFWILALR